MKRIISSLLLLIVLILSLGIPAMAAERCLAMRLYGKHDYDQTDVKKPTCTSGGYYILTCRSCGKTQKVETDGPYGHDWTVAGSMKPTCTENGVNSVYCTICGEEENQTVKALGHNYKVTSVIKEATCLEGGQVKVKCSRCGENAIRKTDKTDHVYGEWVYSVAATDSAKGVRSSKCIHCGKERTEEYYPEGTLYRGIKDEKEAVKTLQTQLTDCGYLNDTIVGIFGSKTEKAVKAFQTAADLNVDGIAWPQTNKLLEKEWMKANGLYAEVCTRVEGENGAVSFLYCEAHKPLMDEVNALFASEDAEEKQVEILTAVREMYQEEVNNIYSAWLEGSADEEKATVMGSQTMFLGYLNTQETVWNKQYGENSVETLTRINDMLHDQWVEICGFVVPAAVE